MNLNFWHRSLLAGDDRQHKLSTRDADERSGTILASIPIVIHISYCQAVPARQTLYSQFIKPNFCTRGFAKCCFHLVDA